jgi:hypothetical protein
MFNGFSAIEYLLKIADYYMPQYKQLVDDAATEWRTVRQPSRPNLRPGDKNIKQAKKQKRRKP